MSSPSTQLAFGPVAAPRERDGERFTQPRWLTEAIACSVHRERGLAQRIAIELGEPVKAVYAVADINDPRPLKAGWIPTICRETNSFAVLDAIEARLGRAAFLLPPTNPHLDEMNRELARTVRQFGAFLETNGDALADGRIEDRELGPLLRSIDAMLAGLSEYRALTIEKYQRDSRV